MGIHWIHSYTGPTEPAKNYREEIPDWFYDTCYKVVEVTGYYPDEEISQRTPRGQQELLERRNDYLVGDVLCYCNAESDPDSNVWGIQVIDKQTWDRWQSILIVQPGVPPRTGHYIMANHSDDWERAYWFQGSRHKHDWRREVKHDNDDLMELLFG